MNSKIIKLWIIIICSLFLKSCITVGVFPLVEKIDKAEENCKLDLYWIKEQVRNPKVDLCEITAVVPHYPWRNHVMGEAFDQAYPQACKCGANGIYIHEIGKGILKVTAFRYEPKLKSQTNIGNSEDFKNRLICLEEGKNSYWSNGKCHIEKNSLKPLNMRQRAQ